MINSENISHIAVDTRCERENRGLYICAQKNKSVKIVIEYI